MSHSDAPLPKVRIDQLLVDRGLAESRTKAQAYIMAGLVSVGDQKIENRARRLQEMQRLPSRARIILGFLVAA